jgi:hypothetical protein
MIEEECAIATNGCKDVHEEPFDSWIQHHKLLISKTNCNTAIEPECMMHVELPENRAINFPSITLGLQH